MTGLGGSALTDIAMSQKTSVQIPKSLHKRIANLAKKQTPKTSTPGLVIYAIENYATAEEAKSVKKGAHDARS